MRVWIDPAINVDYTAFYVSGLYNVFGRSKVVFSGNFFRELPLTRFMKFVVVERDQTRRCVIDWCDDHSISQPDYDWCDVYGKININPKLTPAANQKKLVSIAPSFGIRIWGEAGSAYNGLMNLVRVGRRVGNVKKFLGVYYKQTQQIPLRKYVPKPTASPYVYSLNTLWNSNEWIDNDATVNRYRVNFMNACLSIPELRFEGGFVRSDIPNMNPDFEHLIVKTDWIAKQTYFEKLSASILVFNTPAWAQCHGWKLGEYLALGKPIISTPLSNLLPAPLEHGRHLHIVSGEEAEIREAILLLLNQPSYRAELAHNARAYYEHYATPEASIRRLIEHR